MRHLHGGLDEDSTDDIEDSETHKTSVDDKSQSPPLTDIVDQHSASRSPIREEHFTHCQERLAKGPVIPKDLKARLGVSIIGHHEVTEHAGDGHPRAALDDHQQHQGPEEDAQGGVNAFQ